MKYRYPVSLFISGLIGDFLFHYFFLSIPAIILLIAGIWVKPCLYIALGLFLLDAALSVIERIKLMKTAQAGSDNPDFTEFQEALSSGDWKEGVKAYVESRIAQNENEAEER